MSESIIALYYNPWKEDQNAVTNLISRIINRLKKAVQTKANPRDENYMRSLLDERYPKTDFVIFGDGDYLSKCHDAKKIILLYPDAIGLGFKAVENELFDLIDEEIEIRVLNGRRRDFRLGKSEHHALRLRRLLEVSMFGEIVFTLFFVVITPLLLIIDRARGRI